MKFLKTSIISLFLISAFTLSNQLQAKDGDRYEIVQAGDYTFLLDKEEGATWKYFFISTTGEQGWIRCYTFINRGELVNELSLFPFGDVYSVEKATKIWKKK